jgi:spore coat polysaccharide biosynthesis protein SpsF
MVDFKTEQEALWAGDFGDDYIGRNPQDELMPGRINLFSQIFSNTDSVSSIIEFGANIGNNLHAISLLKPKVELSAIEINQKAVAQLKEREGVKVYNESLLNYSPDYQRDFVFSSGVLIHINPDMLPKVYDLLYQASQRYVCVVEYYNPVPVMETYRGHNDKLFKRDFAGEILDGFSDLKLVNYGFLYHRDNNFPLGDLTWFLMEKR